MEIISRKRLKQPEIFNASLLETRVLPMIRYRSQKTFYEFVKSEHAGNLLRASSRDIALKWEKNFLYDFQISSHMEQQG
jgi:hypothetical protein